MAGWLKGSGSGDGLFPDAAACCLPVVPLPLVLLHSPEREVRSCHIEAASSSVAVAAAVARLPLPQLSTEASLPWSQPDEQGRSGTQGFDQRAMSSSLLIPEGAETASTWLTTVVSVTSSSSSK